MKKVSEIYYCDICKKETKDIFQENISVCYTTDQTEGRYKTPYLDNIKADICVDCYKKYLSVLPSAYGAQGFHTIEGKYWLEKIDG